MYPGRRVFAWLQQSYQRTDALHQACDTLIVRQPAQNRLASDGKPIKMRVLLEYLQQKGGAMLKVFSQTFREQLKQKSKHG